MFGTEGNPAIVALGGGTGLSVLLKGLKKYVSNLTAIVTMADDGGSSGRLRRELGVLPPGDIRSCLVALAEDDSQMTRLFQFRFGDGPLAGHSFGNLFLAALTKMTGDFAESVKFAGDVLGARGAVLPASEDMVSLKAELSDGSLVEGQSFIASSLRSCRRIWLEPADAQPTAAALKAIAQADLIVVGPGSLFTSIIPNFLVRGISQAIAAAKCPKLFVCNVMTQPGETLGFSAADHLAALLEHGGTGIIDTVLVNTAEPPAQTIELYRAQGAQPVAIDAKRLASMGVSVLSADLGFAAGDYFRHDGARLAAAALSLAGVHKPLPAE